MIGFIIFFNTLPYFIRIQLSIVEVDAGFDQATDQANSGFGAVGRVQRRWPWFAQDIGFDIVRCAVGIDIGAGKIGAEQRDSVLGTMAEKFIDDIIFGPSHQAFIAGIVEVGGVGPATMGGIINHSDRALRPAHPVNPVYLWLNVLHSDDFIVV